MKVSLLNVGTTTEMKGLFAIFTGTNKSMDFYNNIAGFFYDKCDIYGEKVFIRNYDGKEYSYNQLKDLTKKTEQYLENFNLDYDDKVSVLLPNIPEFIPLLIAVLARGGVAVNLNINLTADEIRARFSDANVSMVITYPDVYEKIKDVIGDLGISRVVLVKSGNEKGVYNFDLLESVVIGNQTASIQYPENKLAFLQYTGGTTGGIKAAEITHQNVIANIAQINEHLKEKLTDRSEVIPLTFPLYHVFSLTFNIFTFLNVGGTSLFYPIPKDISQLINFIKKENITFLVCVNTLYKLLMQSGKLERSDFANLKVAIGGGEHIQFKTKIDWQKLTGVPVYEAYGMTETSAMAIVNPVNDRNNLETIGMPLPRTEIILLNENDEIIREDNIAGEILIKGPQVIKSYWNKPLENAATFYKGYLRSGDIAVRVNEQYYKIIDRKKDMISVSGFKVFPNEIEAVVNNYSGIADCAVVGEKDEQTGESVVLFYVSDTPLDIDDFTMYCRKHLTAFKIPRKIIKTDFIPKSAIGKSMRSQLRKQLVG
ncbi:MAG: Long-chain-fatty-acid--CoA ligase [Bacteroidota bacterium]|nr:Long-chain-fatty-acid--CoA ligase [Bacteroidota bacterium]